MSCLLTTGRKLNKKGSVGGLKAIYFADYGTLGDATIVSGEITAFAGTPTWFKYDIKGNSSLENTINSSRENGTTFYTQTLNATLPVLDKETLEQVKILSVNRPHVAIEDYKREFPCYGIISRSRSYWWYYCERCCNGRFKWFHFNFRGARNCTNKFCDSICYYC